ncbi:MAG: hypothetical protein LBH25_08355, partial [Fibromonadaceae bacterium]|nr:hypothetical protein [Fibromonadaceae bacterium]
RKGELLIPLQRNSKRNKVCLFPFAEGKGVAAQQTGYPVNGGAVMCESHVPYPMSHFPEHLNTS